MGFRVHRQKSNEKYMDAHTGDMIRAIVPSGKKTGMYTRRVAVRTSGSFNIQTKHTRVQGIGYRYCIILHKSDGYSYQKGEAVLLSTAKTKGLRTAAS